MSGQLFDKYGAILAEDVVVLETCLLEAIYDANGERPVRVVEIGMHDGGTARGIERFLNEHGARLAYVGIDPDPGNTRPRYVPAGGSVVIGDSSEVFREVNEKFNAGLDLVWVDGCHCRGHVILDTINYSPMVRVGGFICYHDANPNGQGRGHQYHGPETPEFGLGISAALEAIQFPWTRPQPWGAWTLVVEKYPNDTWDCGTKAYQRVA